MFDRLYLFLDQLGQIGLLTRDFFRYLFRRPFDSRLLIDQLDSVGYRSLNVVNLTAIFSGMVLALQMGQFLEKFGNDPKREFYIPSAVNTLIGEGSAQVKVLSTPDSWFGMTYREDRPRVTESIRRLVKEGVYPEELWP